MADNVSFQKGRRCNDKSLVFLQLANNCKHVHMDIAMLTDKVIYAKRISHDYRHASCVHTFYPVICVHDLHALYGPIGHTRCVINYILYHFDCLCFVNNFSPYGKLDLDSPCPYVCFDLSDLICT